MQKKKSGVKKCLEICAVKGGGAGPLMANAILNFHFDYLTTSLTLGLGSLLLILCCCFFYHECEGLELKYEIECKLISGTLDSV